MTRKTIDVIFDMDAAAAAASGRLAAVDAVYCRHCRDQHRCVECDMAANLEFKMTCLVHQSLASLAPTYLTTDMHLVSEFGRRPLRSSTDRTLTVTRTHNRFGDRGFAVAGPRLWNSLSKSLRQISSYGQFRRYLKNHLFGF